MTYRDSTAALLSRRETIARQLAESRRAAADAREHEARVAGLEQDLAAVDALLVEEAREPASLLDDVRIASPCPARWEDMIGDDRVRFCGQCTKNVYNLSAVPREEAEALLRAAQEREAGEGAGLCIRIYRRSDGTVLTADCPTGARRKKRRLALFGAIGGGLVAAGAAAGETFMATQTMGGMRPLPRLGEVATMGAVPMPTQAVTPVMPVPAPTVATPPPAHTGWVAGGMPLPPRAELGGLSHGKPRALTGAPVVVRPPSSTMP
ncbi:MAG TPA: hypothetical protein VK762_18170 [Polyangiaceae bacterium]|nr:hypothetical protein [Polyangiaceae bacterium]